MNHPQVTDCVKRWIRDIVIQLNLCPFAYNVYRKGLIRYVVSEATNERMLIQDFLKELQIIHTFPPKDVDTTLLIHPYVLNDFSEYNNFLGTVDLLLKESGSDGIVQAASFHPDYQFEDTTFEDEVTNYTNRSPFPIIHLLREDSLENAIDNYPTPNQIPHNNMKNLRELGLPHMEKLLKSILLDTTS